MTPSPGVEDSLFGLILQDSYKITGLLGEGGMGAVYDALQIRLNKRVAVKVMARELASNVEALSRFHREAMITSGLGHPHIVQVFDFATTPNGQPFLAMEFLDGEDLDTRIARVGCLSAEQTAHIVKQVASALAATHAQQIVHRDLKPANIYLLKVAGEDDFVKVLDFGISKIRVANTKITKASALIGTPDYMSPEQAMGGGEEVDDRTDQWALACIAWECLSGKAPFVADNVPALLFHVVHREPPPLLAADLPVGVETVLRRALAKNKNERFPTVIEFSHALEAAVRDKSLPVQVAAEVTAKVKRNASAPIGASAEQDQPGRPPTTTFGHTAGEARAKERGARRPMWLWPATAGGVAVLTLVLIFALRPSDKGRRQTSTVSPAVAPVATVVPAPAPSVPPPAPTGAATAPAITPPSPPPATEPAAPPQAVAPPAAPAAKAEPAAPAATEAPAATVPPTAKAPHGEEGAESVPAAAAVDSKPHVKRATTRSKTKSLSPEHRLIKEL